MARKLFESLLSLVGAAIGAALGFFAFGWLFRHGYYAMVLPGAMIGIGCGLFSRRDSFVRGILCGLAALAFGVFVDWKHEPFVADESFGYFVKHLNQLDAPQVTLGLIGLGGLISFFIGKSRFISWGTNRPESSSKSRDV